MPPRRFLEDLGLWAFVTAVSPALTIHIYYTTHTLPSWLEWLRLAAIAGVLVASYFSATARRYRPLAVVWAISSWTGKLLLWKMPSVREQQERGFFRNWFNEFSHQAIVALLVLLAAWLFTGRRWHRLWLSVGTFNLWSRLCIAAGLASAPAILIYLRTLSSDWPAFYLPALVCAVVFATVHALLGQINRNILLATIAPSFGLTQATLVLAVLAVLLEGSPFPGRIGPAYTFAFAWLAARATVETRGMLWPTLMYGLPYLAIWYPQLLSNLKR